MRLVLALCLLAAPAFAEDVPTVPKAEDEGFSLMEEGMKLIMRGMMTEMQPALDDYYYEDHDKPDESNPLKDIPDWKYEEDKERSHES